MSDPLYRRELLRLAADARGSGRLTGPTVTGSAFNPSCGDRVTVDLVLREGTVEAIAHETRACVLAQASASIFGQSFNGCRRSDLETLYAEVEAMLARGAAAPDAPFESYDAFDGVAGYPARHRCVLLPLDAVRDAFERLEASEPSRKRT